MPGPRNDACELRLALSYEDLKMNGMDSDAQIAFSSPATSTCSCRDSTTHGPAIRNSGRWSPTSKPHRFMASDRGDELGGRLRGLVALARWCSSAACTKLMKSGWPRRGFDVNSGWNWQPKNHGWLGNSTISTRSPAVALWARAPTNRPAASMRAR